MKMAAKIILAAVVLMASRPASATVLNASKNVVNNASKINSALADSLVGGKPVKFLGGQTHPKADMPAKQGLSMQASLDDGNADMTSKDMEAAITNLMLGKTSFGATPMGGSIKKIKNLITKTMMRKVLAAHRSDQRQLYKLRTEIARCGSVKSSALRKASRLMVTYSKFSRYHKSCRTDEAVKYTSKVNCLRDQRAKRTIKILRCKTFAAISNKWGHTKSNIQVVKKGGSESVQSYITRMSVTFCGRHVHGRRGTRSSRGGWGGGLGNGMLDQYLRAKHACQMAGRAWTAKVRECRRKTHVYNVKKKQCNQYQSLMDGTSCNRAVTVKDACQSYAGCYFSKRRSYQIVERKTRFEEIDRKAEWRGLKRIECLIGAFADGKVTNKEVSACKGKSHSTKLLNIKYPRIPPLTKCSMPRLYATTGAYRRREFAPLPALAKGRPSPACVGMKVVSLRPYSGSPRSCKCHRVNLNGPYSAGALVKCTNCRTVRTSGQRSSCPQGTKIFAPATRSDWRTFIASARPLRAPHWIIDITRPQNGCGGCTRNPMNSRNSRQKTWRTSDGAPWWLRSTRYNEPNGDYNANCYLDLWKTPANENRVTFNDWRCKYYSKSYYCQPTKMNLNPKPGSPSSCKCTNVQLAGTYSPGSLVKCEQCITVYRSNQKNSCPLGMKIFAPRRREDWKTFIKSAGPLRAPHWIVDVTRPQNGCGGCTRYPMKSSTPQQASWRTSDGSPWWLRSLRYNEPNGDYNANCFLDLWRTPNSENNIQFNDWRCNYRSRSYYCQPIQKKRPKPRAVPRPIKIVTPWNSLKTGLFEQAFYFRQGGRCPNLNGRTPNMVRRVSQVYYRNTGGNWPGFSRRDNFAVRWDGILVIQRTGVYTFYIGSDDGSKLYIDHRYVVNNDGLHGFRTRGSSRKLKPSQHRLFLTMFERGGHAGMNFRYRGPDTGNRVWRVGGSRLRYRPSSGWKESQYYIGGMRSVPNLNRYRSGRSRIVGRVAYSNTGRTWPGFFRSNNFAARWQGLLTTYRAGRYRFQLISDDGSNMYMNGRRLVSNDGLHGWRSRYGDAKLRARRKALIKIEFFERGGHAGMWFRYMGPDTRHRMVIVPRRAMRASL